MGTRRLRKTLVTGLLLLAADQALQWTVLRDGDFAGRRVVPFDPPLFTAWQRKRARDVAALAGGDEALRARASFDPELGWCSRPAGAPGIPPAKTRGVRRVVAVGCSFTEGSE